MHAMNFPTHTGELFGGVGSVIRRSGELYTLRAGDERYSARRARSCLLEPREADLVLFGGARTGTLYVLAVLERDDKKTEISVDGDLALRTRRGSCELAADESIRLAAATGVAVTTNTIEVRAQRGDVFLDHLSYLGRRLSAEVEKIKTVASVVDRLFESVRERAQRSYRKIEELEHVRVGALDIAADSNLRMHARQTFVTAEAIVKVNGQQIHLG